MLRIAVALSYLGVLNAIKCCAIVCVSFLIKRSGEFMLVWEDNSFQVDFSLVGTSFVAHAFWSCSRDKHCPVLFVITFFLVSFFGTLSNSCSVQTAEHWIEENTHFPLFIYTYVYVQGNVDEWTCVLVSAIFVYLFLLSPFGQCGVIVPGFSVS